MNKLQKLIALYRKEGLTKTFFWELAFGVKRVWMRGNLKFRKTVYKKLRHALGGMLGWDKLKSPDIYLTLESDSENDKSLYLTFDVEWINIESFTKVLDTLREKQVRATFFLIGKNMEKHPDLLERMHIDGHIVGNHTTNHPDLTVCSCKTVLREMSQCESTYHSLTGRTMPKLMRCPYGETDIFLTRQLKRMGYDIFHWKMHYIDYLKSRPATWDYIKEHLDKCLLPGAIILQHTASDETAAHISKYIDYCREKGYRFASLDEVFEIP